MASTKRSFFDPPVPSALTGKVEEDPAFGRGAVRAARVTRILQDPSWNWSGFLMLYTVVAVLGIAAVVVLIETDAVHVVRWVLAVLGLSGVPTLLAFLFQVHLNYYVFQGSLQYAFLRLVSLTAVSSHQGTVR